MAIFEKTIRNKNFDKLLRKLEQEIPDSSWSANLEAGSDFKEGNARCSVRVFERYSMMGGNRLSLTLTINVHAANVLLIMFHQRKIVGTFAQFAFGRMTRLLLLIATPVT